MATPFSVFVGWVREPRRRWREAVRAPTERTAWLALLRERTLSKTCEKIVLPEGRHP